jgi:hypothetical protein
VGKRFVAQQYRLSCNQRPSQRNPLLLAAGYTGGRRLARWARPTRSSIARARCWDSRRGRWMRSRAKTTFARTLTWGDSA